MESGITTVDFGSGAPVGNDVVIVVPVAGQTGILADSFVEAWLLAKASADHTAEEHALENLSVIAGNIGAGVGFDITVKCTKGKTYGVFNIQWAWKLA